MQPLTGMAIRTPDYVIFKCMVQLLYEYFHLYVLPLSITHEATVQKNEQIE